MVSGDRLNDALATRSRTDLHRAWLTCARLEPPLREGGSFFVERGLVSGVGVRSEERERVVAERSEKREGAAVAPSEVPLGDADGGDLVSFGWCAVTDLR